MTRKLTLIVVLNILCVCAAFAQTTETVSTGPTSTTQQGGVPKASSSPDWSGWYVGGYAGLAVSRAPAHTSTSFTGGYFTAPNIAAINSAGGQKLNATGFTGGGTVGYNHRSHNWVIGAETDCGIMTADRSVSSTTVYPASGPSAFKITQSINTTWLFTARPRVGYTSGKALFYATAGLAMTDLTYAATFTDNFPGYNARESGDGSQKRFGWTGGGGIEVKISDKWSLKGEYLYSNFGGGTVTSNNLTTTPQSYPLNVFTHSISLKENLLRFGFNYHF